MSGRTSGLSTQPAAAAGREDGDVHGVGERLRVARARIAAAAERSGRAPSAITLLAVSKGFPADAVQTARAAGQSEFGESKAQELYRKVGEVGPDAHWHFVGRLQRNKVRGVVEVATLIHSVDRLELAQEIGAAARRADRVQRVLVQVNVGGDPAKAGCSPEEALGLVEEVRQVGGLACQGLMTVPPLRADARPLFRVLRELRDEARARFPEVQHLSMGMSADFEVAVEEGATIVRLGEAIFGTRPVPPAGAAPGGAEQAAGGSRHGQ